MSVQFVSGQGHAIAKIVSLSNMFLLNQNGHNLMVNPLLHFICIFTDVELTHLVGANPNENCVSERQRQRFRAQNTYFVVVLQSKTIFNINHFVRDCRLSCELKVSSV